MQRFSCQSGQSLFFDSGQCIHCRACVRFDPNTLQMIQVSGTGDVLSDSVGNRFYACQNQIEYGNCNWLRPASEGPGLCIACQHNRTIPNLDYPDNLVRWSKLEQAKKRLIYTFRSLGLALDPAELKFDFLEDGRTNPDAFGEEVHHTGYANSVITINIAEADDVVREAERRAVNEQYRTILGHLRHESGHYFFHKIPATLVPQVSALYGDTNANYKTSLEQYYANGPSEDWRDSYISAYASAHPLEDWAECWGHYLHMVDVLETAVSHELLPTTLKTASFSEKISAWRQLSVTLNELNRSIGLDDAYPFLLGEVVTQKLELVAEVIAALGNPEASATA